MTLIAPFIKSWLVELGDNINISWNERPNFQKVEDIEYISDNFVCEYEQIPKTGIVPFFATTSFEVAKAKMLNGDRLPKDTKNAFALVVFENGYRMTYDLALKRKIITLVQYY